VVCASVAADADGEGDGVVCASVAADADGEGDGVVCASVAADADGEGDGVVCAIATFIEVPPIAKAAAKTTTVIRARRERCIY
jgi:hypothetical protein